jgi:hypothetical protein
MRTEARFPTVPARAGHYESFYAKADRPGGGQGVWIRYTVHKPPGEVPSASLWFTFFDGAGDGPRAAKATVGASELGVPEGGFLRIGASSIEPGKLIGSISLDDVEASWDLSFTDGAEALHHLPYERLYRTRLPKTKFLSPYPVSKFSGELAVNGERVALDGWPGMIGHNWGAEHADRWVWIQGSGLGGRDEDYIDVAAGRIKIGPWTTPWVANGRIVLDGEAFRVGGFDRVYGTQLHEEPTGCEFTLPGKNVSIEGRVAAHKKDFVAWVYADPKGPEHNTLNCSISDLKLSVQRPGHAAATVEVNGAAAYEFGSHDDTHGIPVQPYPDG